MPGKDLEVRIVCRVAGLGSLGRQRFAALAHWGGGLVAREAKALAPSAYFWAGGRKRTPGILYQEILNKAVRGRDPFVRMREHWVVRRLAPDCSRIELADLPKSRDELRLLYYMGWETANVHLGTARAKDILTDLSKRKAGWLPDAASRMLKTTRADWKEWRRV